MTSPPRAPWPAWIEAGLVHTDKDALTVLRQASQPLGPMGAECQAVLRAKGMDASRLDGVTWHSCRHTFASRLVMAGVDLRTVQELGGWWTLALVTRSAHMHPGHLRAAVERLARPQTQSEVSSRGTWS